jgi:hypothetical protein
MILTSLNLISTMFAYYFFMKVTGKIRLLLMHTIETKNDEMNLVHELSHTLVTKKEMEIYHNQVNMQYDFLVSKQKIDKKVEKWESLKNAFGKKGEE